MPYWNRQKHVFWALKQQKRRRSRQEEEVSLRTAVIQALFGNGEQGALYDPSDLSTLYQDSAGTTPVTADGDPVGMMLDLSQGLALGSELAGDLDFTDGSWGIAGTGSFTSPNSFSMSTNGGAEDGALLTVGKAYRLELVVTSTSYLRLYNSRGGQTNLISNIGSGSGLSITANFVAADRGLYFRLDSAGDATVDSISVRELPGYHAVQATTAEKPLYDLTSGIHSVEHDLFDDNLVVTLPDLGTDATVKYVTSGGITTLTGQTISGAYTLPQATWQGVVIYEGPMSTAQAEAVDAWLTAKAGL